MRFGEIMIEVEAIILLINSKTVSTRFRCFAMIGHRISVTKLTLEWLKETIKTIREKIFKIVESLTTRYD